MLACAVLLLAGCAVDKEQPGYGDTSGSEGGAGGDSGWNPPSRPSCDEGVVRECKIVIHQANGVESCWAGIQECKDGAWAACNDNEFANATSETP